MTKRQSTTAKITRTIANRILLDCENSNGVIVRHRGKEWGIYMENGRLYATDGAMLFIDELRVNLTGMSIPGRLSLAECTIRKATIDYLPNN